MPLVACGGIGGSPELPSVNTGGGNALDDVAVTQSTPLDTGVVGPITDWNEYKMNMSCTPIKCMIANPNFPDGGGPEETQEGCDTYKLVFKIALRLGPYPSPNTILRVLNTESNQYNDFLTDGTGIAEISVIIDATPEIEFYVAKKLDPESFVPSENYKDCGGKSCVPETDFAPVHKLFLDESCGFLGSETAPAGNWLKKIRGKFKKIQVNLL